MTPRNEQSEPDRQPAEFTPATAAAAPDAPGAALATVLKVVAFLSIAGGVLASLTMWDPRPVLLGVSGMLGSLAAATIIDLLRLIATRR